MSMASKGVRVWVKWRSDSALVHENDGAELEFRYMITSHSLRDKEIVKKSGRRKSSIVVTLGSWCRCHTTLIGVYDAGHIFDLCKQKKETMDLPLRSEDRKAQSA